MIQSIMWNLNNRNHYHFLAFFYFFYFFYSAGFSFWISSFSFFNRFIVTLAVVATLVLNSNAPPAKVILQALHFQIPQACLLTLVYDRFRKYFSAWWAQIFCMLLKLEFLDYFSDGRTVSSSILSSHTNLFGSLSHWY